MVQVNLMEGENVDKMIKRFKKKYEKAGVLKEYRRRSFYVKPSIKMKILRERSRKKIQKVSEERNS